MATPIPDLQSCWGCQVTPQVQKVVLVVRHRPLFSQVPWVYWSDAELCGVLNVEGFGGGRINLESAGALTDDRYP